MATGGFKWLTVAFIGRFRSPVKEYQLSLKVKVKVLPITGY
jgi:hypothetical protein